jgi:aspartyl-tRNA synthetase
LVLRDFYGTTQVVVETEDMMKLRQEHHKESTISVEAEFGNAQARTPSCPHGDIEVCRRRLRYLAAAATTAAL